MTAPAVARKYANFAAANLTRTRSAAARDRELAAKILADPRLADCPPRWAQVATARAAHPDSASWADIGAALGLSKDQAVSSFRMLTRSLGYLGRCPGDHGVKDRT